MKKTLNQPDHNVYEALRKDIYDELFFWIEKKGYDYFFSVSDFYYKSRSGLLTGTIANLPGTKLLVGVDTAENLDETVKKYSLMYDYVIIRHRTFTPPQGMIVDAIPADFAGFGKPDYMDKYIGELQKGLPFPHLQSTPHRSEIKAFHDWVAGPGSSWLRNGNVIYAPFLISTDVEMEAFKDEVSFSNYYLDSRVFPAEDERWIAFSEIAHELLLPTITGCTAEWITKFRQDNTDELDVFRDYLINLVEKTVVYDGDETLYKRSIAELTNNIIGELDSMSARIQKLGMKRYSKSKDIAFDLIPIAVAVFTEQFPPWAKALTLVPAARHFVKNIVESYKAMKEIKKSPLYIMTKLERND